MINRSKYKPIMAAKYLSSKWMRGDSKASIPMLDLYEKYQEWIVDNATGCELDMADFAKKISEVYPDASVKDGVVKGITPYVPKARPKPIPKTTLEKNIEWYLSKFFHDRPNIQYHGFKVSQIINDLEIDNPNVAEEQMTDYLTKSDLYFQHPTKGYWLREWTG